MGADNSMALIWSKYRNVPFRTAAVNSHSPSVSRTLWAAPLSRNCCGTRAGHTRWVAMCRNSHLPSSISVFTNGSGAALVTNSANA